jgi:hypothetical protein
MEDILAISSPFVTAILIILIIFIAKIIRDKSRNQVIIKAIENGVEISPEMFNDQKNKKKYDPLTSALVTIGVGISLFIALYLFFDNEFKYAAFGFIPLFIGLGQLAGYLINRHHKQETNQPE